MKLCTKLLSVASGSGGEFSRRRLSTAWSSTESARPVKWRAMALAALLLAGVASPASAQGVFNPNANSSVHELIVGPAVGGRILACGSFSSIGGQPRSTFARLSIDGVADGMIASCASDPSEQGFAMTGDAQGRILGANGDLFSGVTRYNADGSIDSSFVSTCSGGCGEVHVLAAQPDGKVLIGGNMMQMGGRTSFIFRLNQDGSLDTDFNADMITSGIVRAITVQPDGRILVGGANLMVRLQSNGQLDASQPLVALIPGEGRTVLGFSLQHDGTILVASAQSLVFAGDGVERRSLARLNADGTLDAAFDPQVTGGFYGVAGPPAVQVDGKIIIGGSFTSVGGAAHSYLARLNADGTLDTSFTTQVNGWVRAIGLQGDGKIVVGGDFTTIDGFTRNHLARLSAEGVLETGSTFTVTSYAAMGGAISPLGPQTVVEVAGGATASLTITPDPGFEILSATGCGGSLAGAVFITGAIAADCSVVVTFLPEDQVLTPVSTPFSPNANGGVEELLLQADGKILAAGDFSAIGGQTKARVARLEPIAGVAEAGYADYSSISTASTVYSAVFQADGKVLFGSARGNALRVDTDGTIDPGFGVALLPSSHRIRAVAPQADGTMYIGGYFTSVNGTARANIAKLTENGALDAEFDPGTGTAGAGSTGGQIYSIASEPDGKVVIGGTFTSYNGHAHVGLARLNPDGTLDTTFPAAATAINAVHRQADGSYLLGSNGGRIDLGDGVSPDSTFIRVSAEGARDMSFQAIVTSGEVWTIAEQADGRILVGGSGLQPNGGSPRNLSRFNADGTLDTGFLSSIDGTVNSVVQEADGSILIGGSFWSVNGISSSGIARLDSSGKVITVGGYLVSPVAGLHGTLSPALPQEVSLGETMSFNVVPEPGYTIESVSGCGGTLEGLVYTVGPSADCQILATFIYAPSTVTVTPLAGSNGSLSPSGPQVVLYAQTANFSIEPDPGYVLGAIDGCGGSLSGNVYTTSHVIADCTVEAHFAPDAYVVTLMSDPETGGSVVGPDGVDLTSLSYGTELGITVTRQPGYDFADTGSTPAIACPLSEQALAPDGWTASRTVGPISGDCTVHALFANQPPSFIGGGKLLALVGGGEQTVPGWAHDVVTGNDGEDGQELVGFEITPLSGAELLVSGPSLEPNGTLVFTPGNAPGFALYSVLARDDGGAAHGGSDVSESQIMLIQLVASGGDLSVQVQQDDGLLFPGDVTGFALTVLNAGPQYATDAAVEWTPAAWLDEVSWTCEATAGSACAAAGEGWLAETVSLAPGGTLLYLVDARIALDAPPSMQQSIRVSPGRGQIDPDAENDVAILTVRVDGVFADGLESE